MKIITDIPADVKAAADYLGRMAADNTRFAVIDNRYDRFDYAARAADVTKRVSEQIPRLKKIINEMVEDSGGNIESAR